MKVENRNNYGQNEFNQLAKQNIMITIGFHSSRRRETSSVFWQSDLRSPLSVSSVIVPLVRAVVIPGSRRRRHFLR